MKNYFGIIAAALMACSVLPAQATNVWSTGAKVKTIYPYADSGDGTFVLAFSTPNAPSCTSTSSPKYHYIRVGYNGMTVATAKNILAVAMLAMSMDKEVAVLFDDADANCYIRAISFL